MHAVLRWFSLGLAERDARRNKRTTFWALGIAVLALSVSAAALYVTYSRNQSNTSLDEREITAIERLVDVLSNDEPAGESPQP